MNKKIYVLSDVHLFDDSRNFPEIPPGTDLFILAGDFAEEVNSVKLFKLWMKKQPVLCNIPIIWVFGNHDYYNVNYDVAIDLAKENLRRAGLDNVFVLERESCEYEGLTILGATFWTDYCAHGVANQFKSMRTYNTNIRDADLIDIGMGAAGRSWTAQDALETHLRTKEWIWRVGGELNNANKPFIVVTHHPPCAPPGHSHSHDSLEPSYYNNIVYPIMELQPKMWVYGHTHIPVSYYMDAVHVYSNPLGYGNGVELNHLRQEMNWDLMRTFTLQAGSLITP